MIRAAYVAGIHRAGHALERRGWLARLERRDDRISHWGRSLFAVHDLEAMLELGLPWWTFRAIDAVAVHLDATPGARVLEYGSGASTVWLASRAGEVHTVEHDAGFADALRPHLDPAVGSLLVVPGVADPAPRIASGRHGHTGLDFSRYVAAAAEVGGRFDLIVIDGRARTAVLARVASLLAPGGLVLFDDAWRPRYRAGLAASPLKRRWTVGLSPCLPYPSCTALLRR